MSLPKNVILLGLGSKARNGKDTTANFIKSFEPNVHILHWADKLYEEVRNTSYPEHQIPIIEKHEDGYWCLNKVEQKDNKRTITQDFFTYDELPGFKDIMTDDPKRMFRYNYMTGKDPILLQQWGTNLRRNHFGDDYWVRRTFEDIDKIAEDNKSYDGFVWICIADTRFRNEAAAVQKAGGLYVDIVRLNADNTRFVAPDRDPNHPSEADLNDTKPDWVLQAHNVDELGVAVKDFIHDLKLKYRA